MKQTKKLYKRISALLAIPILLVASLQLNLYLNNSTASAVSSPSSYALMSPDDQAKSYQYYAALYACFGGGLNHGYSDVTSGNLFDGSFAARSVGGLYGSGLGGNDGKMSCGGSEGTSLVSKSLALWHISTLDFVCTGLKYTQPSGCKTGNDSFNPPSNTLANFKSYISSQVYAGGDPTLLGGGMAYSFSVNELLNACTTGTAYTSKPAGASSSNIFALKSSKTASGSYGYTYYVGTAAAGSNAQSYSVTVSTTPGDGNVNTTCGTLLSSANLALDSYLQETSCISQFSDTSLSTACRQGVQSVAPVCSTTYGCFATKISLADQIKYCDKNYADGTAGPNGATVDNSILRSACFTGQGNGSADYCANVASYTGTNLKACIDGSNNTKAWCATAYETPPGNTSGAAYKACVIGASVPAATTLTPGGTATLPTAEAGDPLGSSCTIDSIGWIVCPVITFLANITDGAFGFLSNNFLQTNVKLLDTNGLTFQAWGIMRTFANVAFVIAFLIIIFSQLTGVGVSNYGVKKLLPRVVIAAILVNVSFYICQLAVDLSNILGYSLKDLFDGIANRISNDAITANKDVFATGRGFAGIAGGVLAVAAGGAALYALVGTLVPVLLAALLALVMILFLLVGRQALIVLLIVLSPFAFVAFLLPNTESWFKKWRQAMVALLVLFPIISVVFGASSLASHILSGAFTGNLSGDNDNWFGQIIAAAVLVLPLFIVPVLLKKSLDGIPAVGKFASGLATRANGNLRAKAKESYANGLAGRGSAIRKQARQNFRDKRFAGRLSEGPEKIVGLNNILAGGVPGALSRIPKMDQFSKAFKPAGILGAQRQALVRAAQATAATAQSEEVKQEMARLSGVLGTNPDAIAKHIQEGYTTMNGTEVEAASDLLLSSGGFDQYRSLLGSSGLTQIHGGSLVNSGRRNASDVRQKAADIANFLSGADAKEDVIGGYDGTALDPSSVKVDPATGVATPAKSYIEGAYANAEAAKLITMSPGTAALAEPHIRKDQAKIALAPTNLAEMKTGTQDVLRRISR